MNTDELLVTLERRDGGIALLRLNRPDKLNAVNDQMRQQLFAALREIERDRAIRAVVLTGEGRGFCVGQDLAEFQLSGGRIDDVVRSSYNQLVLRMHALDRPIICAVNGIAAGAGAGLAMAADIRICASNASFLQAFVRIGLIPDTGSTWLLGQLVGIGRAMELAMTGRAVEAEEAERIGLCNRVVEPNDLLDAALELAQQLAALPTRAIGFTKQAIYSAAWRNLPQALEIEAQLQQAASQTSDHNEGMTAFLEKREPAFTGQ